MGSRQRSIFHDKTREIDVDQATVRLNEIACGLANLTESRRWILQRAVSESCTEGASKITSWKRRQKPGTRSSALSER
jgi:hypothetical protein